MKLNLLTFSIVALLYTGCTPREKIIPIPQYPTIQDTTVLNEYPQNSVNNYPEIEQSYPTTTHTESYYPSEEIEVVEENSEIEAPIQTITLPQANNYYEMQSIQGNHLKIGDTGRGFLFPEYQDKIVLLNIFGKECHFCLQEMPIINRLHNKYQNRLQVIAVQAQDKMSSYEAENLMSRFNMNYPIIEKEEAVDLLLSIQKNYGWRGILPYMLLIKNGVTEYSFSGEVAEEELDKNIQSLL